MENESSTPPSLPQQQSSPLPPPTLLRPPYAPTPVAPPPMVYPPGYGQHWMTPPPQRSLVPTADDCTMGMLCHLLSLLTGFLGPLIVWLTKKDQSPFIDHHGREALNLHISLFIYYLGVMALMFAMVFAMPPAALLIFPVVILMGIFFLVIQIMAALAAQRGEWYRYPMCIRFL